MVQPPPNRVFKEAAQYKSVATHIPSDEITSYNRFAASRVQHARASSPRGVEDELVSWYLTARAASRRLMARSQQQSTVQSKAAKQGAADRDVRVAIGAGGRVDASLVAAAARQHRAAGTECFICLSEEAPVGDGDDEAPASVGGVNVHVAEGSLEVAHLLQAAVARIVLCGSSSWGGCPTSPSQTDSMVRLLGDDGVLSSTGDFSAPNVLHTVSRSATTPPAATVAPSSGTLSSALSVLSLAGLTSGSGALWDMFANDSYTQQGDGTTDIAQGDAAVGTAAHVAASIPNRLPPPSKLKPHSSKPTKGVDITQRAPLEDAFAASMSSLVGDLPFDEFTDVEVAQRIARGRLSWPPLGRKVGVSNSGWVRLPCCDGWLHAVCVAALLKASMSQCPRCRKGVLKL